jgi:hypothetical protein
LQRPARWVFLGGCAALVLATAYNGTYYTRVPNPMIPEVNSAAKSDPFTVVYVIDWR